jgi:DNA primase
LRKEDAMPEGFVSFVDVKRAVTMEAILTHYELLEGLSRKGQNLAGPCPFCKGKSQRQFQVNLSKNAWYCFGCKEGGNVLDFVAKREGVSVRAAALKLDSWFKLGLGEASPRPEPSPPVSVAPPVTEMPIPTENPPLAFILKTLDPHHASLEEFGISAATIERFGAGYCTKGLLKGRLAIPIHDRHGELLAYTGLALDAEEAPQYLFPPKFHPSIELFNLHRLIDVPEESGPLYLAPDILGVLRLAEAGYDSALGLFNGSLSEAQEEAIRGALSLYEGFQLVGEGFADRTVARLAQYAAVFWAAELPGRYPLAGGMEEP